MLVNGGVSPGHSNAGAVLGSARGTSILAVTSELPWPLNTGGHLRTFHLLRALARRSRVRLVTPIMRADEASIRAVEAAGITVCPVPAGPRQSWREALHVVSAAARREPYVLYRRHDRRPVRSELARQIRLDAPDVFYFDHLDSLLYDDLRGGSPVVIDLHNVYSRLLQRVATEQRRRTIRFYLQGEASLLRRIEARAARIVDGLLAVSEEEAGYFRELGARRVTVVPNGVDCDSFREFPAGRVDQPPLILYLGSMSWQPNVGAAVYLAEEVLPQVQDRIPDARLRIVGRSPTAEVRALAARPGVEVVADAPDIRPHIREARVMAVPLTSGGGTRLKILEAFAAGLPVVSTPVGCEGIDARHGEHLLVAEREQIAQAVLTLLDDTDLGARLAAQSRRLAWDRYDWQTVGDAACEAISDVISCSSAGDRMRESPQ